MAQKLYNLAKFVPVKITQVSPPIKLTLAEWQLKKKKENMQVTQEQYFAVMM